MSDEPNKTGEIAYVNGDLHVEDVNLKTLADDLAVDLEKLPEVDRGATPVYVYSLAMMKRRYREFKTEMQTIDQDGLICFAVKSLSNQTVLTEFAGWGAGADLVTRGELLRAVKAGFAPSKMVFSGLGKTEADLKEAIALGVQINVESLSELELAQVCADGLGRRARVAIRLNPQLDAMRGHLGRITTGKPDSKFGIPWSRVEERLPSFATTFRDIDLIGASVHIGSNLDVEGADAMSFERTFEFLAGPVTDALAAARERIDPHAGSKAPIIIDVGGGVGIDYEQTPGERSWVEKLPNRNRSLEPYRKLVQKSFGELVRGGRVRLVFEPGRFLTGEAGVLLTRVLHVKKETERQIPGQIERPTFSVRFLIVDAGMNDFIRPSLYGAYHHIVPVRYAAPDIDNVDICGPVCETTDSFMRPTSEWLGRSNNLFVDRANRSAIESDADALLDGDRKLWGQASTFGEVAPNFEPGTGRRTYEYFVKRRFPQSVKAGDLLAILNAGAYGAAMSSEYNSRPLVPEVLVDRNRYAVVRPRPLYEDLINRDCTPVWKGR
jgi:diaminopimelate decarboxylase